MDDVSEVSDADDERQLADDVRAVFGDDVGHQAEHADRSEADNHHHDFHDDFFCGVDEACNLLTLLAGGKAARAEEDRDHDDRQHVSVDHRLKQVVGEDVDNDLHDGGCFLCFIRQLAELRRGERRERALEDVDQHQADDDRQRRGEHIVDEGLKTNRADTLEILKGNDAVGDGEQDNGNNKEFQKVDIDRADGLDPFLCERAHVGKCKCKTREDAERHADKNLDRQTQFLLFFHTYSPFLLRGNPLNTFTTVAH